MASMLTIQNEETGRSLSYDKVECQELIWWNCRDLHRATGDRFWQDLGHKAHSVAISRSRIYLTLRIPHNYFAYFPLEPTSVMTITTQS